MQLIIFLNLSLILATAKAVFLDNVSNTCRKATLTSKSIQWNSVNESTVNKSSRLLHPICLERNRPNPFPL